jgi:cytochrome c551/c552
MSSDPIQYIEDAIKNGSKGKYPKFANMVMPPFSSISKTDREKIAKWILSIKRKKGTTGMGGNNGKRKGKKMMMQ